eukprot:PRCOL_00006530-RA
MRADPTGPSGAHNGLVQDDGIVIELLDPDTSIAATDYAPGAPYTVRVTSSDGEDYAMLLTGPDDVCETERRRKVSHSTAVTMPVAGSSATFVVTLSHSETAFRQHSAVFEAAGFDCVAEIIPGKLAISWATPTTPAVGRKLAAGEASVRVRIDAHASLNAEYVAVGLGAGAKMIGADAAVAWSEDDVARAAAYRLDSYSNPEDGSCGDGGPCPFSDLEGASGADGSVALEATIAMADASNVVLIWAYGPRWKGFHTARGKVVFDAVGGGSSAKVGASKKDVHFTHGVLMLVTWAVLIPLAALVARAMRWGALKAPRWFKVHMGTNAVAAALFVWGIALALARFDSKAIPKAHKEVGLVMLLLWALQVLMGIFRPNASATASKRLGFIPSSLRPQYNIAHRGLGALTLVVGAANCLTGAMRYDFLYDDSSLLLVTWACIALCAVAWIGTELAGWPARGRASAGSSDSADVGLTLGTLGSSNGSSSLAGWSRSGALFK